MSTDQTSTDLTDEMMDSVQSWVDEQVALGWLKPMPVVEPQNEMKPAGVQAIDEAKKWLTMHEMKGFNRPL